MRIYIVQDGRIFRRDSAQTQAVQWLLPSGEWGEAETLDLAFESEEARKGHFINEMKPLLFMDLEDSGAMEDLGGAYSETPDDRKSVMDNEARRKEVGKSIKQTYAHPDDFQPPSTMADIDQLMKELDELDRPLTETVTVIQPPLAERVGSSLGINLQGLSLPAWLKKAESPLKTAPLPGTEERFEESASSPLATSKKQPQFVYKEPSDDERDLRPGSLEMIPLTVIQSSTDLYITELGQIFNERAQLLSESGRWEPFPSDAKILCFPNEDEQTGTLMLNGSRLYFMSSRSVGSEFLANLLKIESAEDRAFYLEEQRLVLESALLSIRSTVGELKLKEAISDFELRTEFTNHKAILTHMMQAWGGLQVSLIQDYYSKDDPEMTYRTAGVSEQLSETIRGLVLLYLKYLPEPRSKARTILTTISSAIENYWKDPAKAYENFYIQKPELTVPEKIQRALQRVPQTPDADEKPGCWHLIAGWWVHYQLSRMLERLPALTFSAEDEQTLNEFLATHLTRLHIPTRVLPKQTGIVSEPDKFDLIQIIEERHMPPEKKQGLIQAIKALNTLNDDVPSLIRRIKFDPVKIHRVKEQVMALAEPYPDQAKLFLKMISRGLTDQENHKPSDWVPLAKAICQEVSVRTVKRTEKDAQGHLSVREEQVSSETLMREMLELGREVSTREKNLRLHVPEEHRADFECFVRAQEQVWKEQVKTYFVQDAEVASEALDQLIKMDLLDESDRSDWKSLPWEFKDILDQILNIGYFDTQHAVYAEQIIHGLESLTLHPRDTITDLEELDYDAYSLASAFEEYSQYCADSLDKRLKVLSPKKAYPQLKPKAIEGRLVWWAKHTPVISLLKSQDATLALVFAKLILPVHQRCLERSLTWGREQDYSPFHQMLYFMNQIVKQAHSTPEASFALADREAAESAKQPWYSTVTEFCTQELKDLTTRNVVHLRAGIQMLEGRYAQLQGCLDACDDQTEVHQAALNSLLEMPWLCLFRNTRVWRELESTIERTVLLDVLPGIQDYLALYKPNQRTRWQLAQSWLFVTDPVEDLPEYFVAENGRILASFGKERSMYVMNDSGDWLRISDLSMTLEQFPNAKNPLGVFSFKPDRLWSVLAKTGYNLLTLGSAFLVLPMWYQLSEQSLPKPVSFMRLSDLEDSAGVPLIRLLRNAKTPLERKSLYEVKKAQFQEAALLVSRRQLADAPSLIYYLSEKGTLYKHVYPSQLFAMQGNGRWEELAECCYQGDAGSLPIHQNQIGFLTPDIRSKERVHLMQLNLVDVEGSSIRVTLSKAHSPEEKSLALLSLTEVIARAADRIRAAVGLANQHAEPLQHEVVSQRKDKEDLDQNNNNGVVYM